MTDVPQQVLFLKLSPEYDSIFNDLYSPVEAKIKTDYQTQEQRSIGDARTYLSTARPSAILAVDAGLLGNTYEHGKLQKEVAKYVSSGGTLIMACLFSSFARPPQLNAFYTRIGLPWRVGDYHRTTFYRNPDFRVTLGPQLHTSLEGSYSMKTVHLQHVPWATRVYVPEASSRTQSMVFVPTEVDLQQCPAVFSQYGKGYIGYIGDVNNEEGSRKLLTAMLHTAITSYDARSNNTHLSEQTLSLIDNCLVCGKSSPVKRCTGCKRAQYCSVGCQKEDWQEHKPSCKASTA